MRKCGSDRTSWPDSEPLVLLGRPGNEVLIVNDSPLAMDTILVCRSFLNIAKDYEWIHRKHSNSWLGRGYGSVRGGNQSRRIQNSST